MMEGSYFSPLTPAAALALQPIARPRTLPNELRQPLLQKEDDEGSAAPLCWRFWAELAESLGYGPAEPPYGHSKREEIEMQRFLS